MDQWRAVMNTVVNLQFPWKAGNFLTSWVIISFSRTLLYGVSLISLSLKYILYEVYIELLMF